MASFDVDDAFQDWMTQIITDHNPSSGGRAWGLSQGAIRCGTAFDNMVTDSAFRKGWAMWIWNNERANLSDALDEKLLDALSVHPRIAVTAWLHLPGLTLAQQRRLRSEFFSNDRTDKKVIFPTIEDEIRQREVVPVTIDEDIRR